MKNLVKKLDELKEKNFSVQGGMQRVVYQLGPHELKLRIYRWDNLSLAINADCAIWYFVNREMSIEEMILGNEHETASYWFGTSDEELMGIEKFIGGFVTDEDLVKYLVHDEYVLKGEVEISKLTNGEVLYRWDNMALRVANVGEAVWYPVKRDEWLGSKGCFYAGLRSCEESEGIEQCARMYVKDEDLIQAIVHKDLVIRRNSSDENLSRLISKIDDIFVAAFGELEENDKVDKALNGVEISVKVGNELFSIDINADTLDNMRALAVSERATNMSREAK